ncbi:1-(5-phosphoribosyl)-5-[(5-phosphoribosylamino)methylideneamino]imidazole-4-carboxamide isomerase [Methanococcoides burtonii]|uniref:1-(5-phosphoribosyl)-5-[(5-phosphoribosylamino)methylideneamino] imidazole-4-carboxamide isomerase n=1 Tax=Methanococcoides burtonii (strain DSM 6242 / NBRC 107633 / OCM 468 / ACE-M) TaxID=259564 RepID=HIS4_METBU|nr:1-(5-phosphoribosyl)-5-[(5-phosphoribosylamino)methylideneamino]imidazole-4-carboxamide isomerase [Methanococcoides burtonii]Q12WC6.1 RecName: Full=1-(5-phosphoribosyl)-5-[(5-phosphoribosylamino)methylideneamino] imidazole-4-carboxamide isomerase; AltName: Full=Phosphoribosylformimino-5-aminoimidazole carboxamide ribotide isomerase [Methanococcoides burtonii DSM 6242]ABE52250.1 1-(5-phosphoribosyl)-5-((5-phosphoribosylamino)methylideneamino) imidazole-4-carboxamide isomerase [Methanococcoides 
MSFEVIPAVDMKGGKCVQLVQGVPGSEMISLDDPVEVALDWVSQGARTLHLIDLDGAIEGNRTNAPIIKKIVEKCKPQGIYIQVGGGIRSFEDAATLLDIGIDKVILSTAALKDPELIKKLSDEFGSEHINVALDSKNGKISIEGWTKESEHTAVEMGSQFEEKGAGSILFTNIDSEGLLNGVNPKPTEELVNAVTIPVIASGGVTTLEDIVTLKNTGAAGVVVGSALYKKRFTLTEAINIISDKN